jgi:hypothetical protein
MFATAFLQEIQQEVDTLFDEKVIFLVKLVAGGARHIYRKYYVWWHTISYKGLWRLGKEGSVL